MTEEERCKHELLPGQCADCRGMSELTTEADVYEGLLIDRFYRAAQHEQVCQMSFRGLQRHLIEVGSPFAMAVHDNKRGVPPWKKLGYVCEECMNKIARPGTSVQ